MHDRKSPSRDSLVVNASIPPKSFFFALFLLVMPGIPVCGILLVFRLVF